MKAISMKIYLFSGVAAIAGLCWAADTARGDGEAKAGGAEPAGASAAVAAKKTDPSGVASAKSELDEMKDEFATLMKKRAGIAARVGESMARINAARSMLTTNPQANTESAKRYRDAAARVEAALDQHPRIKTLQEQYDVAQTQKVALSKQKADVITTWRKGRLERMAKHKAAVEQAGSKAEDARAEILKQAGAKQYNELSGTDQARYLDVEKAWTNELAAAKAALGDVQTIEKSEREKDGSMKRYSELDEGYKALETRQSEIRAQIGQLRGSLRKSDPAIAALQQAAAEASHAHVAALDSDPEVAAARKFIEGADRMRADIDVRARVLRKAILGKDAEYRKTLDAQAASGGLAEAGEDFWKVGG